MRRLLLPALLVYSIILFRAGHQAATLDEADGFLNFATGNLDMSFYPSSGNHVLFSLLARFSTKWFGLSQFTFRLPSMLGAAIYLWAVAAIMIRLAPSRRLLGFAILSVNPFILDYLIAARGYALALGFLAAVVALVLRIVEDEVSLARQIRESVLLSLCAALTIAANFSFAFCVLCTVAAFLIAAVATKPWRGVVGITAAATLPGLGLGYALVGQTIRDYPRSQLYYGAQTWAELWAEMLDAVYPRQNLSMPVFEPVLEVARQAVAYVVLIPLAIALWTAVTTKSWAIRFVCLALTFKLGAHGLAHTFQGLLLPMDRTSLFIAFFLFVLAIHSSEAAPRAFARHASTAVLCASLAIFAVAFRTNYFRIWDFDLDVDQGFAAYAKYAKDHATESAGCTWRYGGAYNFYRLVGNPELPPCDYIDQDNPPPRSAYFLHTPGQAEFIEKARLNVIYRSPVSGLVVGIGPVK